MKKTTLFILIVLGIISLLWAQEKPSDQVLETARRYAQSFGVGQIDSGTPYYGPTEFDIAWCFTVYKNEDRFPPANEIQSHVRQAWEKRKSAESDLEMYSRNIKCFMFMN